MEEEDNLDLIYRNYEHIVHNLECVTKTINEIESNIKQAQKEGKNDAVMQYGQSLKSARENLLYFQEAESRARVKYLDASSKDNDLNAFLDSLGLLRTKYKTDIIMK